MQLSKLLYVSFLFALADSEELFEHTSNKSGNSSQFDIISNHRMTNERLRSSVLYRNGFNLTPSNFSAQPNTNKWKRIDNWIGNTPGKRRGHAASHIITLGADGEEGENMVLYGGFPEDVLRIEFFMTWIYTPASNTWRSILGNWSLPLVYGHTMVTLCGRKVFLFGGRKINQRTTDHSLVNTTYVFDGETESWYGVKAESDNGVVSPRSYHAAANVYQTESDRKCQCKESMLVFGGSHLWDVKYRPKGESNKTFNDLWELRCTGNGYRWIRLSPSNPDSNKPSERYMPSSASSDDVMYIFGGCYFGRHDKCIPYNDLWSYDIRSKQWQSLAALQSVKGLLRLAYINRPAYKSFNGVSGLVLCCRKPFYFYSTQNRTWYPLDMLSSDENYFDLVDSSVAVVQKNVLVYGGGDDPRWLIQDDLWNFTVLSTSVSLIHKKSKTPISPPVRGMQVAAVDEASSMVIVHGGLTTDTVFDGKALIERNSGVWLLDMHALSWAMRYPPKMLSGIDHVGVVLFEPSTVLVTFGGKLMFWQKDVSALTWGYYPASNVWINYRINGSHPRSRRAASALAVDNRTMIMMGGITPQSEILNDVWMFTSIDLHVGEWTELELGHSVKRFGHTTVLLGRKVFLYGGGGPNSSGEFLNDRLCSDELWELDLNVRYLRWQRLDYRGSGPGSICYHSAAGKGEKMIIAGGCQWNTKPMSLYDYDQEIEECKSSSERPEVWYYSIIRGIWDRLAPLPFRDSAFLKGNLLFWGEEQLVAFGGYSVPRNRKTATDDNWYATGFWITTLGCPEGTAGHSFWYSPCDVCPPGRFASFKSSECGNCPRGTTTPDSRAATKKNCTLCDPSENYCHYGDCYLIKELVLQNKFERRCSCNAGFTRDHRGKCVIPTAYVVSLGVILAVFVACCVAFGVNRRFKARKLTSHRQLQEIAALNQVWKINPKEIVLKERIDGDSPGGFGEVYKAEYREMTVAVKKLRKEHNGVRCYAQEFDREIEVMRTLRHPNIVLFFGGGHFDDDSPFLVVEYMTRGSLGAMLQNTKIILTDQQKLKFALDAAEGMAFLHSRSPPRIHRDLKSFNLLVSDRWTVKVSDFGAARLVRQEGMSQRAIRATAETSFTTPLLDADATLTTDCGTLLWSAPELLDWKDYGTPVDVYR
jgi:hypothetical protein